MRLYSSELVIVYSNSFLFFLYYNLRFSNLKEIVVDNEKVKSETKSYQQIPQIRIFENELGEENMKEQIDTNYRQIKSDIVFIIENEMERIKNDPRLQHLIR